MIVISAFPGTGKTYYRRNCPYNKSVADSDSRFFSRSDIWPLNYINMIQVMYDEERFDIMLVSSHLEVRSALAVAKIPYHVVYPSIGLKHEYLRRYVDRGSSSEFVGLLDAKWHEWIRSMACDMDCETKTLLKSNQYLSDVLPKLI